MKLKQYKANLTAYTVEVLTQELQTQQNDWQKIIENHENAKTNEDIKVADETEHYTAESTQELLVSRMGNNDVWANRAFYYRLHYAQDCLTMAKQKAALLANITSQDVIQALSCPVRKDLDGESYRFVAWKYNANTVYLQVEWLNHERPLCRYFDMKLKLDITLPSLTATLIEIDEKQAKRIMKMLRDHDFQTSVAIIIKGKKYKAYKGFDEKGLFVQLFRKNVYFEAIRFPQYNHILNTLKW